MKDEDNLSNGMSNVVFKVFTQIFVSTFTILNVKVSPWEKILAQQTLLTGQKKFHRSLFLEGFYLCFFWIAIKYCQHILIKWFFWNLFQSQDKNWRRKKWMWLFQHQIWEQEILGEDFESCCFLYLSRLLYVFVKVFTSISHTRNFFSVVNTLEDPWHALKICLRVFVKVVAWICLSCYMYLSELFHLFVRVVT